MARPLSLSYIRVPAAFGAVGVFSTGRGICRITLQESTFQDFLNEAVNAFHMTPARECDPLHETARELENYFQGRIRQFRSKIDLNRMTPFQQRVLNALREIPFGAKRSYQWVAEQIGHPQACRAVGAACAANPVPILIPCHRVISKDGALGGFSAGLKIKKSLLDLERRICGDTR